MQSACAVLYYLWPVWLSHIFSAISDERHGFRKIVTEHKVCVLIFFTTLYQTFLILKVIRRDIIINVCTFHVKYPFFLSDFNDTLIFLADSKKNPSNIKFDENPSSGDRVIPCGPTDT